MRKHALHHAFLLLAALMAILQQILCTPTEAQRESSQQMITESEENNTQEGSNAQEAIEATPQEHTTHILTTEEIAAREERLRQRRRFQREEEEAQRRAKWWKDPRYWVLGFGGAFAFWRSIIASKQAKTAAQGQATDRFVNAAELLNARDDTGDNSKLTTRLGGIYALEKLAQEDPGRYQWAVIELLTTFLMTNAPRHEVEKAETPRCRDEYLIAGGEQLTKPKPKPEIQAIMGVLCLRLDIRWKWWRWSKWGIRRFTDRKGRVWTIRRLDGLDLRSVDFRGIDLRGANLSGASLGGADLSEANLCGANLKGANLCNANLNGANLSEANLSGASLFRAQIMGAELSRAELRRTELLGADLSDSNLFRANLSRALIGGVNLQRADLREANLSWASLDGAILALASLRGANVTKASFGKHAGAIELRGANLRETKGLTKEQLEGTKGNEFTLVRADLRPQPAEDGNWQEEAGEIERMKWHQELSRLGYTRLRGLLEE